MTIGQVVGWWFYGIIRYIVFWIPYVTPPPVDRSIPWQWWRYHGWSDWRHRDDNNGGPDEWWIQCWFDMVYGEALILTQIAAEPYVDSAKAWLRDLIGYIKSGWDSLGSWVDWLERLFGLPLPWWSTTLDRGLRWLRLKFPSSIREGWRTWEQIWDGLKEDVRNWVQATYDFFRDLAQNAWNWVTNTGIAIQAWRDRVAGWIDNFRNDPYGTVTSWLGDTWSWLANFRNYAWSIVRSYLGPNLDKLLTFGRDCCTFYYNLWSIGWRTLGEFCDDPLDYLYRKAEEALIDRW